MPARTQRSIGIVVAAAVLVVGALAAWRLSAPYLREPSAVAYAEHCAGCHGESLEGGNGPALVDVPLRHGDDTAAILASIGVGFVESGDRRRGEDAARGVDRRAEHAFAATLGAETTKGLALYVAERRRHWPTTAASHVARIPSGVVRSRHHDFRVEKLAELSDRPYSLLAMPDGRFLVTGKERGLWLVEADGGARIVPGTPESHGILVELGGAYFGLGWHLDLALHPDHAENGWIYLSHTDRCHWDCGSLLPVSMVRVVRGRLREGAWVDEEEIFAVDAAHYTPVPDQVACGRLAIGRDGSLFVTVGGKAPYRHLHDLDTPYGKVHRVRDDGRVPEDNPFRVPPGQRSEASTRHTVWSYGHRTSQGLGIHPRTGELWQTEMGPRGGDEVNLIRAGGNYGWPLYTNGLDYDGDRITIGEDLGLDFPFEDTVAPAVDFTPAPALSSFTFASGSAFPAWADDLLVGSLKARTLYRVRTAGGVAIEREVLLAGLGRIRDVEVGPDGHVYLLLEHGRSASIVRLLPVARTADVPPD